MPRIYSYSRSGFYSCVSGVGHPESDSEDTLIHLGLIIAQASLTLQEENAELLAYKNNIESQKKRELINSFYMLTDEDKKDVNENINKYSYDEIESKLAVICCRKKVSFDKDDTEEVNNNVLTYNLNHVDSNNDLPAWLKAVEETKQKNI